MGEYDPVDDGVLNQEAFTEVLCKITNAESPSKVPFSLVANSFNDADLDWTRTINFAEFARWFSKNGFSEEVLLSQEQRQIRQIARRHELNIAEVERYKSK